MQSSRRHVCVCYFIVAILFVLLENHNSVLAQGVPSTGCQPANLTLMGKGKEGTDFLFKIGDSLRIKATAGCFQRAKEQLGSGEASRGFKLVLDNVSMTNLPVNAVIVGEQELMLTFYLARQSQDDDNRKAWDTLLEKQRGTYEFTLPVALAVGDQPAWLVQSVSPFKFYIARGEMVWGTLAVGGMIFLIAFYLLTQSPTVLRDAPNGSYSLGKSQMAFWGLLVVLTFAGIWFLAGTIERIPPQILILIGISGATGLSSIVIGKSKKFDEISSLQAEQQTLERQKLVAATMFPPASEERLGVAKARIGALSQVPASTSVPELQNEMATLQAEQQALEKQELSAAGIFPPLSEARLGEVNSRMAELKQEVQSVGFWQDICDDGNGMSFHRLQAAMWTVVLGIIFVDSVSQVLSMPEFSETLLVLLGISNGTYLGFKFPEKT